jgi:radical SAM superfamily enzyme YgiQ (UPF0313 family)
MNALLVYPEAPPRTYWSFKHTLPYVDRRAAHPPLGLITVAALLPSHWSLRLVDMNVEPLLDDDLIWADVVLTSSMVVQAGSLDEVVERCNRLGVPVAAGGPYPSGCPDRLAGVDHRFVGEAEGAIEAFAADLEAGRARRRYDAPRAPDVDTSPVPRFDLLDLSAYASMAIQHSRGCPFSCEFCDIWKLYGRRPRIKAPGRVRAELDALHAAGWTGSVFFVDDNFIGNPRLARRSLAAIEAWQREHGFPFQLYTEASLNLGADDVLLAGMRDAGFNFVFLGIESPSAESLAGANKPQNAKLDLLATVRKIQSYGIEVSSGFIVGFDEDEDDIFDRQIEFIRRAGIPMAMVGILTALEGTALHDRLAREGRLLSESGGDNTHVFEPNFVPRMPVARLVAGYKRVMHTLYGPTLADYFDRCRRLLDRLGPNPRFGRRVVWRELRAFGRSLATVVTRAYGREYARFLLWTAVRHPARFAEAVRLGLMGFHFEAITREAIACDGIRHESERLADRFRARIADIAGDARTRYVADRARVRAILAERARVLGVLRRKIRGLGPDARESASRRYADALARIDESVGQHSARAARLLSRGKHRFETLQRTLRRDVEALRSRYVRGRAAATDVPGQFSDEARELRRTGRDLLAAARRRVRSLPREYRILGRLELRAVRARLDLVFAGLDGLPERT